MIDFEDREILVTGGTRGIGRAIAEHLAKVGAKVIVTGRSPSPPQGLPFEYLDVDFNVPEEVKVFCGILEERQGLFGVVNNAGINRIHRGEDFPEEDLEAIFEVNFSSVFRVLQSASRVMLKNSTLGRIVNVGSIWATQTRIGRTAYCASKAGVAGMTRAFATDLAEFGILVNTLSPGFVATELTRETMGESGIAEVSSQIPLGRLAEPEEIAEVVSFLLSPKNTYLTGQNIIVDGGFTNV